MPDSSGGPRNPACPTTQFSGETISPEYKPRARPGSPEQDPDLDFPGAPEGIRTPNLLIRSPEKSVHEVLLGLGQSGNVQVGPSSCPSPSCPIRAGSLTFEHPRNTPDTLPYEPDHPAPTTGQRAPIHLSSADNPALTDSKGNTTRPTGTTPRHPAHSDNGSPHTATEPAPARFLQCADASAVLDALRGITISHDDQNLLERITAWDHTILGPLASLFRRVRIADNRGRRK
jgi:hypothetical protein